VPGSTRTCMFISSGGANHLGELSHLLPALTELEQIGSRTDTIPAADLAAEVNARLEEEKLQGLPESAYDELSAIHQQAAKPSRSSLPNR